LGRTLLSKNIKLYLYKRSNKIMADQVRIIVSPSDTEAGSFNIYEYRFDVNGDPQAVPFLIASNVPLSSLISPGYLISINDSSYGIVLEDVADRGLGCSGSTVEQLYSNIKISNQFSIAEGSIDIVSVLFGTLSFTPLPSQNNSLYYHVDTGTTVEDTTNISIFNYATEYGALYNWYAATYSIGGASIAPPGWHVPTDVECQILINNLEGWEFAGSHLKEAGVSHWSAPNDYADNSSGFTGVGAGERYATGEYEDFKGSCFIHTSDDYQDGFAYGIGLLYNSTGAGQWQGMTGDLGKHFGCSIRLIKDNSTNLGSMTDIDGNFYKTVKIGDQVWMAFNLNVNHYNDGTLIPNLTDAGDWTGDTAGAMCYYDNDPNNAYILTPKSYILTLRDSDSVSPFVSSDTILPNTGKTISFNNTFLSPNKLFMITLDSIAPTPSVTPTITTSTSIIVSKSPTPTITKTPFTTPSRTPPGITPSKTPSTSIIVSNAIVSNTPSPTTTMTPFATPSRTPPGITPSVTPSRTPTITPSLSISKTPSKTPSRTPTVTSSPSISVTPSLSISRTPLATPSLSTSKTPSLSISKTPSKTPSLSISATPSLSISKTPSPSRSKTPSMTLSMAYMIWNVTVDTFTTTIAACVDPRDGTKYSTVGRTPANLTTLYNDTGLTSIYVAGGTHPGYISFSTGGGVVYSGSQNSGGTISSNAAC
jgi:uncharacterized protein (TIGR02145 family)